MPFGAAPTGDMFPRKIGKIFKDLPNVFGITDDILVVGFDRDGKDHDVTLQRVLEVCRQVNLKLHKEKYHFRCIQVPFIGNLYPGYGVKCDPQKVKK